MKVHAKAPCASNLYEVVEETANYYLVKDSMGCNAVKALSKADYKPVQEWVDVTRECYAIPMDSSYKIYHRTSPGCGGSWIGDTNKYRVTGADSLATIKVEAKK